MNRPNAIDPELIDRLVDGELDPESRRALLLRLDAAPEGWRRCALAFLEAQEFGLAARAWTGEHAGPSSKAPARRTAHASPSRLAMAATVAAVAFFGGFAARGWAEVPAVERGPSDRLVAETGPAQAPRPAAAVEGDPTRPGPAPAEESPPLMPDYVRAQWARLGYQVERSYKKISMEEDGRRVTLPLEGYRVEYVGRPTY